jgi:hypothetical protein
VADAPLDVGAPMDPAPVSSWGARTIDPARGTLPTNAVEATVLASGPRIRACGAAGSAVVRIFVASDGKVASASYFRDHLTAGAACLLEVVRSLQFPAPGERAEVLVPFVFRAKPAP